MWTLSHSGNTNRYNRVHHITLAYQTHSLRHTKHTHSTADEKKFHLHKSRFDTRFCSVVLKGTISSFLNWLWAQRVTTLPVDKSTPGEYQCTVLIGWTTSTVSYVWRCQLQFSVPCDPKFWWEVTRLLHTAGPLPILITIYNSCWGPPTPQTLCKC